MLVSGIVMVYMELQQQWQFQLYQWHKSGGVLLMIALVARIFIRIATPIPSLPTHLSKLEQTGAKIGHWGLYVAMAGMVLSGWAMVSSSPYGLPTIVFGWFEWPHITPLQANQKAEELSRDLHFFTAIGLGLLLLIHLGAVIKHHVIDRENLLTRIWWNSSTPFTTSPAKLLRPALLVTLLSAIVLSAYLLLPLLSPLSTNPSSKPSVAEGAADSDTASAPIVVTAAHSHDFIVDTDHSRVTFSGTHMGSHFSGVFEEWQAYFHFNPAALDQSRIDATFATRSAATGDAMYDGTLLEEDWFASAAYPQAVFTSDKIVAHSDDDRGSGYRVTGLLTLRGISKPITFDMYVRDSHATAIQLEASFVIDRLAYDIGASSDPEGDWVSRDIAIQLDIYANRH